ncbi:hypothetical protein Cs7R123_71920 [Catellatospora sp. TT07R-123]|uniref:DUF3515 domain-containing protein n=1 Tax=Catellatospora sp. TT07R-123 TaxID=2733863 RepID=UPI001B215E9A|nr:DUF3515 domain-containing protein [Catellatospora sp. TT07R-123]GHJ49850.1 hypothetical protein Cs7R123_71920 [Catellatospora sp. TT07R-123]
MSNDQATRPADRSAKLLAAAIAVPVALAAGYAFFQVMRPADAPAAAPKPSVGTSASPQVMPTAPVVMATPVLGDRQATVCRALLSQLPEQVGGLPRRQVSGGFEQNAAWGDPALMLTCGGTTPTFPPTDDVYKLDGVCWHESAGTLTTVDREVPVSVTVPAGRPAELIIEFSKTLIETVPSAATMPTGCR